MRRVKWPQGGNQTGGRGQERNRGQQKAEGSREQLCGVRYQYWVFLVMKKEKEEEEGKGGDVIVQFDCWRWWCCTH